MERLTSIQTIEHADGTSHEQIYCFGHLWGPAFFKKGTKDYEEYMAIVKRLAEYEDLEEQGKLLKLPCAVGDTVYQIIFDKYTKCSAYKREFNEYYCEECEKECDSQKEYHIEKVEGCHLDWILEYRDEFEKTVFLIWEEAEAALKEL